MRNFRVTGMAAAVMAVACVFGQTEVQGIPARVAPSDYQTQAKAGKYTIAADFVSHSLPTLQGVILSEDYVAVEVAFFGAEKLKLSFEDFSLKINDRKTPAGAVQYGMVMKSLSDPEWIPPAVEEKSKGGVSAGGGAAAGAPKPEPPKMPFPLRRAMEQKVVKVALAEGERALPQAGLVFFPYRGKDSSIKAAELIYDGPAGKAVLTFAR